MKILKLRCNTTDFWKCEAVKITGEDIVAIQKKFWTRKWETCYSGADEITFYSREIHMSKEELHIKKIIKDGKTFLKVSHYSEPGNFPRWDTAFYSFE